uniref:Uncharacterized protein n=1 Tax=uncultured marine group II/III euryarchaeote KM3_31_G09 TaxID=1456432 RepID=A0A075GXS0_9EURY|nr:hypothetical protein [uncultured marine group II/III euryarchaeote KM3_31_G09]
MMITQHTINLSCHQVVGGFGTLATTVDLPHTTMLIAIPKIQLIVLSHLHLQRYLLPAKDSMLTLKQEAKE